MPKHLARRQLPATFKKSGLPPDTPPEPVQSTAEGPLTPGGFSLEEINEQIAALKQKESQAVEERLLAIEQELDAKRDAVGASTAKPAKRATAAKSQAKGRSTSSTQPHADDEEADILAALARKREAEDLARSHMEDAVKKMAKTCSAANIAGHNLCFVCHSISV